MDEWICIWLGNWNTVIRWWTSEISVQYSSYTFFIRKYVCAQKENIMEVMFPLTFCKAICNQKTCLMLFWFWNLDIFFEMPNLYMSYFWMEKFIKYFVIFSLSSFASRFLQNRCNNEQWHIGFLWLLKVSDLKLNFLFLLLSSSCLVLALILILHLPAKQ